METTNQKDLNTKEVFTFSECSEYLGMSKSCLYKLTHKKAIPHYKPTGKLVYFNRKEVEAWVMSNRVATEEELNRVAINYCMKGGRI